MKPMTPTIQFVRQISIFTATITGSLWVSTQWAAYRLGYHSALGEPWFLVHTFPLYYPWRLFEWWIAYEAHAAHVFHQAGAIAAGGSALGTFIAVGASFWREQHANTVTTYGSARWATSRDIRRSGLGNARGVFLGECGRSYLRHDGPEHVLAFAPTRSGKGVGLVVPTLLTWAGSAVIHDIKGELWRLTLGWRSKFSRCLLFNPTDRTSARYNPLLEVRKGAQEVRDVQNIADILVDPDGTPQRRNHWEKTAHALLTAAILHVLYAEGDKTLSGVSEFLANPKRTIEATLRLMMTTNHLGTRDAPKAHPQVASIAREMLNKSENELSGVVSTAMSFMEIYRDPIVAQATSACDWRIDDLKSAGQPVSLYLVVPPSDLSRTKPLIRLILNQIGRRLTEHFPEPGAEGLSDRQLLMMLDEFPALGRLDFFESALGYMAGYGIRAYLIAQSLNQIDKAYGPNNAILDNAHVRVVFTANDERTAKRISDALGTATEERTLKNYNGHRLAPWLSNVVVSRQETARALLTPGEVMQLPRDEALVLLSGTPPIRARKIRYFEDRNFIERVLPAPEPVTTSTALNASAGFRDDWGGQRKGVSRKLQRNTRGGRTSSEIGNGGLDPQPDLFEGPTNERACAPTTDIALLDDDFRRSKPCEKPPSRRGSGLRKRQNAAQRQHAPASEFRRGCER